MMPSDILATSALTNPNQYFLFEPVLIGSLSQENRKTTNPKVQAITRWLRSQMKNSGVKPRPSSGPHLATRYAITYSATTPIRSNAARTKALARVSHDSNPVGATSSFQAPWTRAPYFMAGLSE